MGVMNTDTSAEQAREVLRREHNVQLVTSAQEGFAAEKLPDGVYGFTGSPALASPLFAGRHYRDFEIHRLPNGKTALIGFVRSVEAAALAQSAPHEPVTVTLHPDVDGDATTIVSVPYDRVIHHRQYLVRTTAAITLRVLPGAESLFV
jgi:hypothetical protein